MRKAPVTLLLALMGLMTSGALLGYSLSAGGPTLIERVGITPGQLGSLASVAFVAAAVTSVGLGRLADRAPVVAQTIGMHLASFLALVLAAFATHYWVLFVAAVLAGGPLAMCNPTTNRILLRAVPPFQRAGWVGLKQSGVQVAQLLTGLLLPPLVLALGWRGAALGVAVVVVALAAEGVWAVRRADPPPAPAPARVAEPAARRLPAAVWVIAGISTVAGFGMQSTNVFLPTFAVRALGYPLTIGGLAAAVVGGVGVVSRSLWGRITRALDRPSTAFGLIFLGAVGSGVSLWVASLTGARALLWLAAVLVGASTLGANVVVNATVMDLVPPERVGAASGIISMCMYAGFAAGPFTMGLLRDATGAFSTGWAAVSVVYALGLGLALVLRRRDVSRRRRR